MMESSLTDTELAAVTRVEANMAILQQDGMQRLEIAFNSRTLRKRRRHNLLQFMRANRKPLGKR